MPRYEYACRDCGEHVEVVQSFKDAPLTTCGICDGRLRKVFSAAGIIFKGSGYYVTDSRGNGERGNGERGNGERRNGGRREGSEASKPGETSGESGDGGGGADSAAPARAESA